MFQRILAITVGTDETDNLKAWKGTAESLGYPYAVLGTGEKFQGWKWRTRKYLDYLKTLKGSVDIVLLLDGNDVFFTGPVEEFVEKFQRMNSPLVIGAESACCSGKWNNGEIHNFAKEYCKKMANIDLPYIYPNGGGVFGFYDNVLELLDLNKDEEDDQAGYLQQIILNPGMIKLDYTQAIIGNHSYTQTSQTDEIWEFSPETGRFRNRLTKEHPVIMHFPGSNNTKFSDYNNFLQRVSGKTIEEYSSPTIHDQVHGLSSPLSIGLIILGISLVLTLFLFYLRKRRVI